MNIATRTRGELFPRPFFRNFFDSDPFGRTALTTQLWDTASPAINIAESDSEYTIELAAPGFDKEDFDINVSDNVMTISAEAESEEEDEDLQYSRKEYNFSSFSHSFTLPDDVADEDITAEYTNGVLFVSLPKAEQKPVAAGKNINIR